MNDDCPCFGWHHSAAPLLCVTATSPPVPVTLAQCGLCQMPARCLWVGTRYKCDAVMSSPAKTSSWCQESSPCPSGCALPHHLPSRNVPWEDPQGCSGSSMPLNTSLSSPLITDKVLAFTWISCGFYVDSSKERPTLHFQESPIYIEHNNLNIAQIQQHTRDWKIL